MTEYTVEIAETNYSIETTPTTYTVELCTVTPSVAVLSDVSLTSLANGEVLVYNSTTENWENGTAGSGDMLASTYDPTNIAGDAFARANHTGTQIASTISDFATTVQGLSINNVSEDTTPQLGGNLSYNAKGLIIESQTVGGNDGELVYLSGADTWSQADASAEATCKSLLGIRVDATTVLTKGIYTTTGLTAGSVYYASETGGAITTTAPSTSTSIVRIIGYAISTTQLFVDPDKTYIEVA